MKVVVSASSQIKNLIDEMHCGDKKSKDRCGRYKKGQSEQCYLVLVTRSDSLGLKVVM